MKHFVLNPKSFKILKLIIISKLLINVHDDLYLFKRNNNYVKLDHLTIKGYIILLTSSRQKHNFRF